MSLGGTIYEALIFEESLSISPEERWNVMDLNRDL